MYDCDDPPMDPPAPLAMPLAPFSPDAPAKNYTRHSSLVTRHSHRMLRSDALPASNVRSSSLNGRKAFCRAMAIGGGSAL
jgi:hypothetical protein